MQINIGYFYFIKDKFFEIIDYKELMKNKVLNLYNHGMKNIVFPNIDKILEQLIKMERN